MPITRMLLPRVVCIALISIVSAFYARAQPASYAVTSERVVFPVRIEGRDYQLEAMLYRPDDAGRHPLVIFSHGRNGMRPPRDPNMVNGYSEICRALASSGRVVAYIVRRGYGNSDGPDSELQDTAISSGLEAAKDYQAALDYWRTKDFVLPDRIVLMGQSQGGWSVLACTNVAMPGVLGVVNISGGTNYRLMGTGAVTPAVQDHWVAACTELGRGALVPGFWIYSENDLSISGPTARRMFDAFTAVGGEASLLMLPPYGSNGHGIVGSPNLFIAPLNDFLAMIGFVEGAQVPPAIGTPTGATALVPGGTAVFKANVTGDPVPALQWRKDGVDLHDGGNISGANTDTLTILNVQSGDAGSYALSARSFAGSATSEPATLTVVARPAQVTVATGDLSARIVNLSTRGVVSTGDNVLIAGFVIDGTAPKKLLILASGLNLARHLGLTGEIGRPHFTIYRMVAGQNVFVAENNDWQFNAAEIASLIAQVGAQPLSESSDPAHGDAGLVITLAPGVYSVVVAPDAASANQDGIGLVELYDATPDSGSRLTNISSRGLLQTGLRQMIVGVVIDGTGRSRLMVRSVGPSLKPFGIDRPLENPSLSLFQHSGGRRTLVEVNDDWWNSAQTDQIAALSPTLGAFVLGGYSTDSVVLRSLAPGVYSAVVAGGEVSSSGLVLTEIYDANVP